eukprot:scaffold28325_cov36-Phaeocystis_antarctica.AAC.2
MAAAMAAAEAAACAVATWAACNAPARKARLEKAPCGQAHRSRSCARAYGQHSRPWHVRIQKSDSRSARGSEVPTPAAVASAASISATDARLRSKVCSRISTPPRLRASSAPARRACARPSPARGSGGATRCPFFCEAGSSAKARQPSATCIAQKRPPHGESCGSRDGAPPLGAASPLAADRVHA